MILHSPAWIVLIAFAVRVLWIALAHTYRFRTSEPTSDSARRLDASPIRWPTAWDSVLPLAATPARLPGPPRLIRGSSRWLFAPWQLLARGGIRDAHLQQPLWGAHRLDHLSHGRRIFGGTVALWAGWIWALLSHTIFWSVKWIWETSLSAFLLSLLFMLTVEMEGDERPSSWLGYGLL